MVCPPTYGDGGGPWSGTRTVRQMAGSTLHKKVQRGAGEACSAPTLPSLLLSRPQVTALPAPLPQRLCLGSLRPFQAWSSLTFTPASPIPDNPFPSPSCCVLKFWDPCSMSLPSPSESVSRNLRLLSAERGSLPLHKDPLGCTMEIEA